MIIGPPHVRAPAHAVAGTLSRNPSTVWMRPESSLTATSKPRSVPVTRPARLPAEPGLVVVPVDRPGQPEAEVGELLLDRADHRCDCLAAVGDARSGLDVASTAARSLIDLLSVG